MHEDYFWSVICLRLNVGSLCDHNKTNTPYTKHKEEMLCRIVRGEVSAKLTDAYVDNAN
jgi:hypothetical protein